MEEDNAGDVCKFVQKLREGELAMRVRFGTLEFTAKLCTYGNLLVLQSTSRPMEPIVFVMERYHIRKDEDETPNLFPFSIVFADEILQLIPTSTEQREKLMLELATCSHTMTTARMDEVAYKFFTMQIIDGQNDDLSHGSTLQNYFLANPFSVTHNFAITSKMNLPLWRFSYKEVMWESKFSIMLPLEMIKLYKRWGREFANILESKQSFYPSTDIAGLQDTLRHVRDNLEIYEQSLEFLQGHSGALFRPSVEKTRVAYAPVPTNLHIQYFNVQGEAAKCIVTAGTASCLPLRFHHGGLEKLIDGVKISSQWMNRAFDLKQSELGDVKREIGELSRLLTPEKSALKTLDGIFIEISTGIKQVRERLKDMSNRIPDCDSISQALSYSTQLNNKVDGVLDAVSNQLEALTTQIISLDTKIATADVTDNGQELVFESIKSAIEISLNAELELCNTLSECLLLSFIRSLNRGKAITPYFHVQLRTDFVLSQAITIVATALLVRIQQGWPVDGNGNALPPLLIIFSWLSPYGDEKGMIEDATEAWSLLGQIVSFRFVPAPSTLSRSCIPIIGGKRTNIQVSLPIPHDVYELLPPNVARADGWRVQPAYFNLGINHEASLAQQWGGPALESQVNHTALLAMQNYVHSLPAINTVVKEALFELTNTINAEASRKNMEIFEKAMALAEALGVQVVIGCKSGKDRTSMGITLEQGRRLRETHGFDHDQVMEIVTCLRKDGVRRENCRKNIGKGAYAFSPFQMHFIPKTLRPPAGTYSSNITT
ncbi:unnamed protein product, partial [Mesorhabditis belari]|uniref:Uncharacterized protein n=1 Tax=Mesorhabditis belari TaxID=2138241 RepID=A0AAF3E9H8_9BILA